MSASAPAATVSDRQPRLSHAQAVGLMVLATLLWSIAGVVTRQLSSARSFEVTFWRSFFTAVAFLVLLPLWQGRGVWLRVPWRSGWLWLSGLCWAVMFTSFMVALTMTTVAQVLVTMATGPLMTAVLARLVLGQRQPARTWIAIVVAGLGMAGMYASQIDWSGQGGHQWGAWVAFLVPLAGSVQWILAQRSQLHGQRLDLVPSVLLGGMLSALGTLPLALPMQASSTDLAWLALLGAFQLAVPCSLAVVCSRVLPAPEVALLALLEVLFGIALAWVGANEVPGREVLLGGSVVMAALAANEWLGWRQRRVRTDR